MGNESDSHGVNRATAMNNLIGSLSRESIKDMLINQEITECEYLTTNIFNKIDVDKSGFHDAPEITKFLMTSGVKPDEIKPLIDKFIAGDTNKDNKFD